MTRAPLPLLAALGLLAAAPAAAAPRVTLRRERATLHQLLVELQTQTGYYLRGQEGEGGAGYREPPNAPRADIRWQSLPWAHAMREICTAFRLEAGATDSGSGYWFQKGALPPSRGTASGPVSVTVGSLAQEEQRRTVLGRDPGARRSTLGLSLNCRALDGEGDSLGRIFRLELVDERGRRHAAIRPERAVPSIDAPPDEAAYQFSFTVTGEQPRRIDRLEGDLLLHPEVSEHRLLIPLGTPLPSLPAEHRSGPLRLTLLRLEPVRGGELAAAYRLEWDAGVEVPTESAGAPRAWLRLADGTRAFLFGELVQGAPRPGGTRLEFTGRVRPGAPAVALELRAATRQEASRTVSFTLRNVRLPWDTTPQVRLAPLRERPAPTPAAAAAPVLPEPAAPASFADPRGGSLRLPAGPLDAEGRLGLRRLLPEGWSHWRWLSLPTADPLRVVRLRPGTYEIRLQYWLRVPGGVRRLEAGREVRKQVQVRAGQETVL